MNNQMPTYEELLEINMQLGNLCKKLKAVIHEQNMQIDEFLAASTLYRELYIELKYNNNN